MSGEAPHSCPEASATSRRLKRRGEARRRSFGLSSLLQVIVLVLDLQAVRRRGVSRGEAVSQMRRGSWSRVSASYREEGTVNGFKARSKGGTGMHRRTRSEAEGRFGEAEPAVMTRPTVASQSEVARGLRASVCARAQTIGVNISTLVFDFSNVCFRRRLRGRFRAWYRVSAAPVNRRSGSPSAF